MTKFSHSLALNSSPEWRDFYLSYSKLKKIAYILEKATLGTGNIPETVKELRGMAEIMSPSVPEVIDVIDENEHLHTSNADLESALLVPKMSLQNANEFFTSSLDAELTKISVFYDRKYSEISAELESIISSIKATETDQQNLYGGGPRPQYLPYLLWNTPSLQEAKEKFQQKLKECFIRLTDLHDYVDINETGFGKVLKKYEKVVGGVIKEDYIAKVLESKAFTSDDRQALKRDTDRLIEFYARISNEGNAVAAKGELKAVLRDHIVYERNTVWRDMVDHERRRETFGFVNEDLPTAKSVYLKSAMGIGLATLILVLCCYSEFFPKQEMNSCLGILLFASILWAFESVPLFVTGLIIPFLVVILRVMVVNGIRLSAKDTAKKVFGEMFGPVIILLLGGFSLAAGLSKHNIAKQMANLILHRAGSDPRNVILANMFVSSFMSMWISNVAAPVLCFSLINPILRNLPRHSGYGKSLVMGIAMAANVGGMASPIASPQNVISMGIMSPPPSWLEWFLIAIPVCVLLDLSIWGVLLFVYKPGDVGIAPPELSVKRESLTAKQYWIIGVSVGTILLWCGESIFEEFIGDMGVIALIPIIAFYGIGVLTKDDWNSMLWSVVMLAMGGIALGKAVDSSGLLTEIAGGLVDNLKNLTPFMCMALLSGVVVVVTSFISHTVGALIILPIVAQIGILLPDPRPRSLVMACALMCSGGMALPVSSFPNMNAISLEDSRGEPWLSVKDFLKIGTISSILAWFLVVGVGWTVMTMLEFQ